MKILKKLLYFVICKKIRRLALNDRHEMNGFLDNKRKIIHDSAISGCSDAQYLLAGESWTTGAYSDALDWYTKAAERDNHEAIFQLAKIFFYGDNIAQDYERAFQYFYKLASIGHQYGQYFLGLHYYYGYGCLPNKKFAAYWIAKVYDEIGSARLFWDDHELWKYE